MPSNMWGEFTYPFLNFNDATVEVWEWISNFIPYFLIDAIINPCWDLSYSMSAKGAGDIEVRQEGVLHDTSIVPDHLMSHLFGTKKLNVSIKVSLNTSNLIS